MERLVEDIQTEDSTRRLGVGFIVIGISGAARLNTSGSPRRFNRSSRIKHHQSGIIIRHRCVKKRDFQPIHLTIRHSHKSYAGSAVEAALGILRRLIAHFNIRQIRNRAFRVERGYMVIIRRHYKNHIAQLVTGRTFNQISPKLPPIIGISSA